LCLQTLDGILCHDGEIHTSNLVPEKEKTFETLADVPGFQGKDACKRSAAGRKGLRGSCLCGLPTHPT
ncbi:MAG: hypothetical protein SVT56_08885, partial [Chloroflexota bacterium]|nr:hypothetical protein [Chloroflexota bacterium]